MERDEIIEMLKDQILQLQQSINSNADGDLPGSTFLRGEQYATVKILKSIIGDDVITLPTFPRHMVGSISK